MKIISLPVFLILMLSLGGCSLFGWSENGMRRSKPIIEREEWAKPSKDEKKREEDWISCGGNSAGHVNFPPLTHDGLLTVDDYMQADKRSDAAQACMISKGYHYIGSCKGALSRRLACKGRSIFNL